jgi:uncharacterized repeat protein (TIGR01451 family)
MARKTTVFFLILVLGSLTDISWAQSAGPTGSSQVLRWSSPRPQVRQVSTEPRLLTPSDKGTTDSKRPNSAVKRAAAEDQIAPVEETTEGATGSILKRNVGDDSGEPQAKSPKPIRPGVMSESEVEVKVAARRLGGAARGGSTTPTSDPPTDNATGGGTGSAEAPQTADVSGEPNVVTGPTSGTGTTNDNAPRLLGRTAPGTQGATESPAASQPADAANAKMAGAKGLALRCPQPSLQVEAVGPKSVTVGRPAAYTVSVQNSSQDVATGVEVRTFLPDWMETIALQAAAGEVARLTAAETQAEVGYVNWVIPEIAPGGRIDLLIQMVPRENRAFELAVEWTLQPPRISAPVAVQQPQLEMMIAGPKEALYGENVTLVVTVANPGTGDAENVSVRFASGANPPETITVGTILAGQQKQIEVQIAASQAGKIAISTDATAEGDIKAATATELMVRRANVQLALASPAKAFTGSPVTYQLRVSNIGDAPSEDTLLNVVLPVGAKVEASTEGSQSTDTGLKWRIGAMQPGIERTFEIQCVVMTAGENRLEAAVTAATGLSATQTATTDVQAIADLKLVVVEPTGARRVGEDVAYDVAITNRGSKAAEDVNVLVQFSDGVEPVAADGAPAELADGQVVFNSIPRIGPGQKAQLKVRARADKAGNHRFRVQVTGDEAETQLVFEGTTRFFGEAAASPAKPAAGPARPAPFANPPGSIAPTSAISVPTPARRPTPAKR